MPNVFQVHLAATFVLIGIGYICSLLVSYSLAGDCDGETDETRVQIREAKLKAAQTSLAEIQLRIADAKGAVDIGRAQLAEVLTIEQSAAYRREIEADRLRRVDASRLHPDEFERYVGEIFAFLGFATKLNGRPGDQGADVIVARPGMRIAVQVKRYNSSSVGNSAVQEAYAAQAHHHCDRCCVVTNAECFTSGAIALAGSTGCILICREHILKLIEGEIVF